MQRVLITFPLIIVPIICGIPWASIMKSKKPVVAAYGIGFFSEMALFHIVTFVGSVMYTPFHVISVIFNIGLVIITTLSLYYSHHHKLFNYNNKSRDILKLSIYECALIVLFLVSFSIQIVRGFTYDLTYMSYDDAMYVAYASDALQSDYIGIIDSATGGSTGFYLQRAIQSSLVFPAYLSILSGIQITTIVHTIQYIQYVVLAYTIYYYMAEELFSKRENKFLFISLISVFYIFGYHSHYSLTFRLLGPNYQGKAVLAVSLTPLVFIFLFKKLSEKYDWKSGMLLFIYSISAVSLTLWGIGTMIAIITIPITLSLLRRDRQWQHLLYLLWGLITPFGFAVYYLLNR